jgi:hypothetical protein
VQPQSWTPNSNGTVSHPASRQHWEMQTGDFGPVGTLIEILCDQDVRQCQLFTLLSRGIPSVPATGRGGMELSPGWPEPALGCGWGLEMGRGIGTCKSRLHSIHIFCNPVSSDLASLTTYPRHVSPTIAR